MNGDHLRRAGALMEAHGMTKWTRHDYNERMCALGALDRAMYGHTFSTPYMIGMGADLSTEVRVLADVMRELYPNRAIGWEPATPAQVVAFINNHNDTTLEDVLVAFEKAAMRMDEVGELA